MLSKEEVEKSIATDLGREWELKDGKLVKSFQFSSFMQAIDFVNEIAKIAETLEHHPIITINWKSVKLSLKSFDIGAITKRDIALATEIERKLKGNNSSDLLKDTLTFINKTSYQMANQSKDVINNDSLNTAELIAKKIGIGFADVLGNISGELKQGIESK